MAMLSIRAETQLNDSIHIETEHGVKNGKKPGGAAR